jgi:4-carboxymuconolactone decarboxylase
MSSNDESFERGMKIRRAMFGAAGAEDRLAAATGLNLPLEEAVTRYCFGDTWSRPGLDLKIRSLLTLATLTALSKPNQLKVHVRGAIANGATPIEIREAILHSMVYAGIPAGVEAFTAAGEVFAQMNIDIPK